MVEYNELNDMCLKVLEGNRFTPPLVLDAFNMLYLSGCRVNEITDIGRWTVNSSNNVRLKPLKGNNFRFIDNDSVTAYFLSSLVSGNAPYLDVYDSALRYYLKRLLPVYPLKVKNKNLLLNIFRHRYIKALSVEGMNDSEIKMFMGYTNDNTHLNYKNSIIVA